MRNKGFGFILSVVTSGNIKLGRLGLLFLILSSVMVLACVDVRSAKVNPEATSSAKAKSSKLPDEAAEIAKNMIFVKGGCYLMGDIFGAGLSNEKPVHEVCVDDFYIGKYEVTQGQWLAIMGDNPAHFKDCGSNCPVEQVSWDDAQKFITKLNSLAGTNKYRLPTEAEWEYAARSGGKSEQFSGGADLEKVAWYEENSEQRTHPVGEKQPNGLGLYDMSGNVWEWVQDKYNDKAYRTHEHTNPICENSGVYRVMRGSGWHYPPNYVRASYRDSNPPSASSNDIGFRLVRAM